MAQDQDRGRGSVWTGSGETTSATLFLEDTVQIQLDWGSPVIGVIAKTWHDLEDQDIWEEILETIPGNRATEADLSSFLETGQPPRHFYWFAPSAPQNLPVLVHENECKLLDRAFLFGDVVKRSLSSPQSGTVISVQSKVTLHHSFIDPNPDSGEIRSVENVPDSELKFTNEMKPGEFVVYRNCWMGIVEDVSEILQVKLKNGAVVEVNGEEHVEIPVATSGHWTQPAESESFPVGHASARVEPAAPAQLSGKRGCLASKTKTVPPPAQLSPGQTVMVRAELWDLRYVFGSYDPSVSPIGVVVDSKVSRIEVNWICQNMMVKAPFVSVEKPPMMMIWKEVSDDIRIFKKSSGGYVNTEGQKYTHVNEASGGGELQVGDRVKFIDIDAAVAKYQGMVKKFLPAETMGFDINTFIVAATRTTVRILWQDTTETIDDARNLVPYLNVDDHEVWPGEIVVIRPEESFNAGEKLEQQVDVDSILSEQDHYGRSLFEACEAIRPTGGHEPPKMEFMRPQRVGVVQSVNSADRVAVVRWFASPRIDVAAGFLIPGSETGPLEPTAEDVSLYDAVAHQAIGVQRGDMVLVAPLNSDAQQGKPEVPSQSTAAPSNVDSGHLNQIINRGHGTVNGGLISNLSAALGSHSSPHLQAVSRALNQLPELVATHFPSMDVISYNSTDSFADQQSGWLGEVVHLDMEGQATVRLGALKEPRDIRVPVEKLHIVFNDEMDFGDDDLEDEDENYDTDSEEMSSNDDIIEYVHASERQVIEEKVFYEGGERLDNGKEEDWLTDSEGENDSVSDKILDQGLTGRAPTPPDDLTDSAVPKNSESESTPPKADSGAEVSLDTVLVTANTDAQAAAPSLSDNMPVPEVFSLSATAGSPPRFMVLDEQIPSDHAFRNHVKTSMYSAYARRIAREHKILSTSLPEGIFVRTWESRLDLMRVLIIGPLNTPYELAPFVFDFHFTSAFPVNPPVGYFHSWTNGIGRVNPNLYEDGKICLSLLGTWHAERRGESWTSSGSTVLQLLVSLMGLVLVREPWYNEAGFGVYEGAEEASLNSQLYSEKAYILARGFVKHVLQHPVQGFETVIKWLYLPLDEPESEHQAASSNDDDKGREIGKEIEIAGTRPVLLKDVIRKARDVVKRSEGEEVVIAAQTTEGVGRVSRGALALLKRTLGVLEQILEPRGEQTCTSDL